MANELWDELSPYLTIAFQWAVEAARWFTFYFPQAGLLFFYPNSTYLTIVTKRYKDVVSGRRDGLKADNSAAPGLDVAHSPLGNFILFAVVLLPLCYLYVTQYHLLDCALPKRDTQETLESSDDVPDELLDTSLDTGLTQDAVEARQKIYGWNELDKGRDWLFFFQVLLVWPDAAGNVSLEVEALLALLLGDWLAAAIMLGLLFVNVGTTVYQTRQSDAVFASLAPEDSVWATVVRDGQKQEIPARELVPGDIVYLGEGQTIPADCRIMSEGATEQLLTDQSAITGDPESISKDYGDICYYTCGVKSGQAIARVEAIAPASFVGRTAALMVGAGVSISRRRGQQARSKANSVWARKPRQTMQSIGAVFGVFVLATVVTLVSTLETSRTWPWILELCVALMVAALPTRWDVMVTTIRSCGAALLAQSGAVVQRVHDVEGLAGVDVLCVDKTGTMTANIIKVTKTSCHIGTPEDVILSAGLASAILASSDPSSLDSIDEACAQALDEYGVSMDGYELIEFHPFESSTNYIRSDVIAPSGEKETHAKGAPKAIMELCNQHADDYINDARAFARQGLRSLGVARKVDGKEWELLGQIALEDPPRADAAAVIKQAQELGIDVKMLTGDAAATASLSARRFGLKHACVDTESVFANTKSETEKAKQCDHASVFSELSSAYRLDIVRTLQQTGHIVAITGDGSEDTAALRLADVGVAVEGASEKAQAAAEYVFFESGISAILMAVQRCRQIFELSFTYLQSRTMLSLHLVVVITWYALTYGEVFDPTLLLLALHCNESVTPAPSGPDADIPFPKKPVEWSSRVLWTSTLPLALILGAGTMLSIHSCEMHADVAATDTATRQQIIFLHTVLASSPLLLLKRTNSRFWKLLTWKRGAGMILAVDVAATASCLLGRAAANGSLDFASLRMVWICSIGSIVAAAGWLAVASAEKYDADDD